MFYFRLIFLVLFLFSSGSSWALSHLFTLKTPSLLIGKAAPDAVLAKTDGTTASVMGSRQGKKAILIFWATWCGPCYEDLGTIYRNFASIERKDIKIILVDAGETKEDVRKYFKKRRMAMVSFIDGKSSLQGPYHLILLPTLIFIDDKGIIRSVTHAFPSNYENYFRVK
jgi:thiol-disulfide isomerase/thioredoxin